MPARPVVLPVLVLAAEMEDDARGRRLRRDPMALHAHLETQLLLVPLRRLRRIMHKYGDGPHFREHDARSAHAGICFPERAQSRGTGSRRKLGLSPKDSISTTLGWPLVIEASTP